MNIETIHISNLLLDLDNPRFPRIVESQREAINLMLEIQSDKIEFLAKDIAEHGLDPSERLIVYKNEISDDETSFTVAEGNRRITALKLLNEPELSDHEKVITRFKKILQTNPELPENVDCVVFDDPDEFEHWISLKHSGQNNGVGRVRWDTKEQERYLSKNGVLSFGSQFLKFIENESSFGEDITSKFKLLKLTNITRLLGDPAVREVLALEVSEGKLFCSQKKERFIIEISKLIRAMQEIDDKGKVIFTVNKIRHKSDRRDVINELSITKPEEKLGKYWELANPKSYKPEEKKVESVEPFSGGNPNEGINNDRPTNSENINPQINDDQEKEKPQKNDKDDKENITVKPNPNRNNLIPSNVKFNISNKKCKKIYDELKGRLRHDDCPMAISVLFRVFLELSLICYLEKNSIVLKKQQQGLHDKVVAVSNDLKLKNILSNNEVSSVQSVSSSITQSQGSLQQYMHNKDTLPDKSSLNTHFDNLYCLFSAIWR
ncbi:TPA: hypothetical protein ACGE8O_002361 [Yersinia enterocolitica]